MAHRLSCARVTDLRGEERLGSLPRLVGIAAKVEIAREHIPTGMGIHQPGPELQDQRTALVHDSDCILPGPGPDVYHSFAKLRSAPCNETDQEGSLPNVKIMARVDRHRHILVEVDRIGVGGLLVAFEPATEEPWCGRQESLARHVHQSKLDTRVIPLSRMRDLLGLNPSGNGQHLRSVHVRSPSRPHARQPRKEAHRRAGHCVCGSCRKGWRLCENVEAVG